MSYQIDTQDAYLPYFQNNEGDNTTQHLKYFHNYKPNRILHQEDVLMELFMMSLEYDARKWYRRLPPSTIYLDLNKNENNIDITINEKMQ